MDRNGNAHPAISTKEELLRLLRERSAPRSAATLEPGRGLGINAKRQTDEENHKRIAALRNTLAKAHDNLEEQQTFARLSGFIKARFANER